MNEDWYIGIRAFCEHWKHAPMLQQTLEALTQTFEEDNDACIDAAKALVECACRVIIENLDDPANPMKPTETSPSFGRWMTAAVRVLGLGEQRDESFKKLISQYHSLTTTLGDLRKTAGTLSHGKDGFIAQLSRHQRRAAILAADAIISFLHEAYLELEPDPIRSLEPYERFSSANDLIDSGVGIEAVEDLETAAVQLTIHLPNGDEMPLNVEVSRLLFAIDRQAYKDVLVVCRDVVAIEADLGGDE